MATKDKSSREEDGLKELGALLNKDGVSGTDINFYGVDASTIDENARKLLIDYAGVSPENVESHVDAVVSPIRIITASVLAHI